TPPSRHIHPFPTRRSSDLESGARVAVVGRDQQRADEAAAAIGNGAKGFATDVSDTAAVTKLIDDVEKAFGSIDVLVNNAGITRRSEEHTSELQSLRHLVCR